MKSAKATCLVWTVLFFVLAGAAGWFVYRRAPDGSVAFFGGFGGGVLLIIVLSWIVAIPVRLAEWWLIVRARFGAEPRDGKRAAIIGPLRGYGELQSPFRRERCVLYSYEIITRDVHDGETTERRMYEGFAMAPLSIEHGVERVRILARPAIPKLPVTHAKSRTHEANAKHFVESTTFAPAPMKVTEPDLSHSDGHYRYDHHRAPLETNFGACVLNESVLLPNTNVCALGIYRADRRALLAPVTLRTGASFAIGAAWRVVNAAIALVIFSAITLAAAAVFCANFPIDALEQAHPQWTLDWWEVDLERFVDQRVRPPMIAAGMLDEPGYRLQEVCDGCADGLLVVDGRTIDLKHARYTGGRSVHISPQPDATDGVTLTGNHVTLTIDGKSAGVPASWLQKNDIQTSLGENGDYAGRVTVMAPDGSIRCRVHFRTRVEAEAWLRGGGR
ncbi:MAG TPA: hypothetical protein VF618_21690 [Thermoanaerobaculia bacterium]